MLAYRMLSALMRETRAAGVFADAQSIPLSEQRDDCCRCTPDPRPVSYQLTPAVEDREQSEVSGMLAP